jgi:hypothetical protein
MMMRVKVNALRGLQSQRTMNCPCTNRPCCDHREGLAKIIKHNMIVGWTELSREEIHSAMRSAVKTVLVKKKVRKEGLEPFLGSYMMQAQAFTLSDHWDQAGLRIFDVKR